MSKDEHLIRPIAGAHRPSTLPIHRPVAECLQVLHEQNGQFRSGSCALDPVYQLPDLVFGVKRRV